MYVYEFKDGSMMMARDVESVCLCVEKIEVDVDTSWFG